MPPLSRFPFSSWRPRRSTSSGCFGHTEAQELYDAYNEKYDWNYSTDEYGPLTTIAPATVLAWRSAGWAGREGFQQTGRWRFGTDP